MIGIGAGGFVLDFEGQMEVFVSHSSADRWVASRIEKELTELGAQVFIDAKDIENGQSILTRVGEGLKDSDECPILLPPKSIQSSWVLMEMGVRWLSKSN